MKKKKREVRVRIIAIQFIMIFLFQIISPTVSLALTGGPSQPEVNSFEPVGTTQMVDLYSGDFNYNIPLLNVPGSNGSYPINIAYHAGIGMDQEASWVGLGWNINPGAVVRQMRGLPDDFNGDKVIKRYSIKKDWTFGINPGGTIEALGFDLGKGFKNSPLQVGLYYNSYRGVGYTVGANFSSLSSKSIQSKDGKSVMGANLGLSFNFNSQGGMTAKPSLSFSKISNEKKKMFTVGPTFSSVQGISDISADYTPYEKSSFTGKFATTFARGAGVSFSSSSYIPGIQSPMVSSSFFGGVNFGADNPPAYKKVKLNFNYTQTKVENEYQEVDAYGLLHLEGAKNNHGSAIMDFNREKDGEISKNSPYAPMPVRNNDIYSIQGQGTGGAFRAFRSDIGHLTDPIRKSRGNNFTLNVESGVGTGIEMGADFNYGFSRSYSGPWKTGNHSISQLERYESTGGHSQAPKYEPFYFKSNGEMTSSEVNEIDRIGGDEPIAFDMGLHWEWFGIKPKVKNTYNGNYASFSNRSTTKREKRNQAIEYLTQGEIKQIFYPTTSYPNEVSGKDHHIHQMSVTNPDGNKYVYGLPAYNSIQKDVSFSVNSPATSYSDVYNDNPKLVSYSASDATTGNDKGQEHYFSSTILPDYAHSYMLTAIKSQDYVDVTGNGVSEDDFGYWTKFSYEEVSGYKWRVPYEQANYMKGNYSNTQDDKASYTYGEKTLKYLDTIQTNTHFAVFEKGDRADGVAVASEAGGIGSVKQKYLKSITLYSKADVTTPIKKVHFEYDYSMCQGIPSNDGTTDGYITSNQTGKLTLKKIYFTHLDNSKGKLNPYIFDYGTVASNPDYSDFMVDRWGNYQPSAGSYYNNSESSYTRQDNSYTNRDNNSGAWSLSKVTLPSGGEINVEYESDDYLHVQDQKAMQMFKIVGTSSTSETIPNTMDDGKLSNDRRRIYFEVNETLSSSTDVKKYIDGIEDLYFKAFMELKPEDSKKYHDYIRGYVPVDNVSYGRSSANIGFFDLELVGYRGKKKGMFKANPFQLTGWKQMRYSRPDLFNNYQPANGVADITNFVTKNVKKIIKESVALMAGYFNSCKALNYCDKIVLDNSFKQLSYVRLNSSDRKYGGGHRVKSIKIKSGWGAEEYGQEYSYENANGESSGVAEYEPLTGGDEISLRKPIIFDKSDFPRPAHEDYKEAPYGESFFPGAKVGYSRVIVKNLQDTEITKAQTGVSVNEFFTSKDYPVIVKKANSSVLHKGYNIPIPIPFVGTQSFANNGYSIGYTVIVNDMPGKPKSVSTYPYSANLTGDPVSRTRYNYQTKNGYNPNKVNELENTVTVLDGHGQSRKAVIGQTYDFYIDQSEHSSYGMSTGLNVNITIPPPYIIPIPSAVPPFEYNQNLYRHVITNKVIYRNGVLKSVENMADGAIVTAENMIWDAETGQVLLTQSNNEFKKPVYNYTYAAHWAYDRMGGAYKNYRANFDLTTVSSGVHTLPSTLKVEDLVKLGDKIAESGNLGTYGYVVAIDKTANTFTLNTKFGGLKNLSSASSVMVMESGNSNMQSISNGNIVSLEDPSGMSVTNLFSHVLSLFQHNKTVNTNIHLCNGDIVKAINFFVDPITGEGGIINLDYSTGTVNQGCEYDIVPSYNSSTVFNLNTIVNMGNTFITVKGFDNNGPKTYSITLKTDSICKSCTGFPILQASAIEFCDTCWEYNYEDVGSPKNENNDAIAHNASFNPYYYGQKGVWRTKKSYAYQANRKQHGSQGNKTKINVDGEFDFVPFDWKNTFTGNPNWTWASEITQYSPYGFQLENKNPLGIYSSEMYGYKNTVVTAVGSNASYMEIAFDGFEDYNYLSTTGGGVNIYQYAKHGHLNFTNGLVKNKVAHTGNNSLEVEAGGYALYNSANNYFQPKKDKKYILSAWTYTKGNDPTGNIQVNVNGTVTTGVVTNKFKEIDGWSKIEVEFDIPSTLTSFSVKLNSPDTDTDVYFDDIRISPFNGGMKTYVYNPKTLWLVAELDNLNYATFYNYDEEGSLTQIKKETNKGIVTVKSTRNNTSH